MTDFERLCEWMDWEYLPAGPEPEACYEWFHNYRQMTDGDAFTEAGAVAVLEKLLFDSPQHKQFAWALKEYADEETSTNEPFCVFVRDTTLTIKPWEQDDD